MAEELERRIAEAYSEQAIRKSPEALQRIVGRRAAGERIELGESLKSNAWRYRLLAAGVAASLLVFVWVSGRKEKTPKGESPVGRLAEVGLMPQMLMAQGAEHPSYPVLALDGRDIKPGRWSYGFLKGSEQYSESTEVSRMRLTRDEYQGKPAWLILTGLTRGTSPDAWGDSTWVDLTTLRRLARSSRVMNGRGRLTEEYREHEVLKGFTIGGSTSWNVIAITEDSSGQTSGVAVPMVGDVFFMALKRAPLASDWRGSIQLLSDPVYNRGVKRWLDLAVVGEERITVPAGEFDCWRVRFGPPAEFRDLGAMYLWVSKERQWVVKQGVETGPQGGFWSVMVSGRED